MFKHYYRGEPSYSQPILYKSIFPGKKYFAHHALEDSKALHKMISTASETFNKDVYSLFSEVPVKKKTKNKIEKDHSFYFNIYICNNM